MNTASVARIVRFTEARESDESICIPESSWAVSLMGINNLQFGFSFGTS